MRGEREEEVSAMAHEKKETAARLRELEAASNRLKTARKDDLKRVTKERSQALDRCKVSCPYCQGFADWGCHKFKFSDFLSLQISCQSKCRRNF